MDQDGFAERKSSVTAHQENGLELISPSRRSSVLPFSQVAPTPDHPPSSTIVQIVLKTISGTIVTSPLLYSMPLSQSAPPASTTP